MLEILRESSLAKFVSELKNKGQVWPLFCLGVCMTFYLVYKTTNNINSKFYIGSHQTNNIDDGYLGSGKILKQAINKYGRENFTRIIIAQCISSKVSRDVEGHIVRYSIEKYGRGCYNRSYNGTGAMLGKDNSFYGKNHSDETKKKLSEIASQRVGEKNSFYGRKHKPETIARILETRPNSENCPKMLESFLRRSTGWFCTPIGCFYSDRYAAKITGLGRNCIRAWCKNPDKMVKPNYQIPEQYWGRTWRENGFYFVENTR